MISSINKVITSGVLLLSQASLNSYNFIVNMPQELKYDNVKSKVKMDPLACEGLKDVKGQYFSPVGGNYVLYRSRCYTDLKTYYKNEIYNNKNDTEEYRNKIEEINQIQSAEGDEDWIRIAKDRGVFFHEGSASNWVLGKKLYQTMNLDFKPSYSDLIVLKFANPDSDNFNEIYKESKISVGKDQVELIPYFDIYDSGKQEFHRIIVNRENCNKIPRGLYDPCGFIGPRYKTKN